MGLENVPPKLATRLRLQSGSRSPAVFSWRLAFLDGPDLLGCLKSFWLKKSSIIVGGGGRSQIPQQLDGYLNARGWEEHQFDIGIRVDGADIDIPTHKIDNFKAGVGIEVEWNYKTEFYDRDLNNFRLLHQLRVMSVGVIITRASGLQELFDELGIGAKYGNSTTHWNKLLPKIDGGGAGGCPVLAIGITRSCYDASV